MKIAEKMAEQDGSLGLITGESIGQVASQTIHSLACTNEVCTMRYSGRSSDSTSRRLWTLR